jgi:ketosteroid isomerase-like protein
MVVERADDSEARKSRRESIVLRLYNDGWMRGDFDVVCELVDAGILWTAIESAPDAGTYRGHEGVRAYMQDWLDDFDFEWWRIEESIEVGGRLVCAQRARGTGNGSGVTSDISYACVYSFGEDEQIVEIREYATQDEALAAAKG